MSLTNTSGKYTNLAMILHWLSALILFLLIFLGKYNDLFPEWRGILIQNHKALGVLVLFLLLPFRISWRLRHRPPPPFSGVPLWQQLSAQTVHWGLYGLMFLLPLTGLIWSLAASRPINFWSIAQLNVPQMANADLANILNPTHRFLGDVLIVLICLHIGAALYHHFIRHEAIFRRMWFGNSKEMKG